MEKVLKRDVAFQQKFILQPKVAERRAKKRQSGSSKNNISSSYFTKIARTFSRTNARVLFFTTSYMYICMYTICFQRTVENRQRERFAVDV